MTGDTRSDTFPVTNGAFDTSYNDKEEVIVFKLNQNGSKLIYSTFIGGNYSEVGCDITVDHFGNAFITGSTVSLDFPTTSDAYDTSLNAGDCFLIKISNNSTGLDYSTYIGGDIAGIGNNLMIVAPSDVKVERRKLRGKFA